MVSPTRVNCTISLPLPAAWGEEEDDEPLSIFLLALREKVLVHKGDEKGKVRRWAETTNRLLLQLEGEEVEVIKDEAT
jgi:hypothetical protein